MPISNCPDGFWETRTKADRLKRITQLFRLARVHHWVKNVIVLFPLAFSMHLGDAHGWARAILAMLAFCLTSSAVYAINDVHDRHADRLHPRKRLRPIASGDVSVGAALALAGALALGGLLVAARVNPVVLGLVAAYVALQMVYTFWLKGKMLLDVMCIATGFVLRAAGGAQAIPVYISPWLIICTFMLCLFMGFCKRRCEVRTLADAEQATRHRHVLRAYTPELLTHLITLSAGLAVVSLMLYATSPKTIERYHTIALLYTTPIFLYAVARFAMLCIVGAYDDPTDLILRDHPFQITVIMWMMAVIVAIVWGKDLGDIARRVVEGTPL